MIGNKTKDTATETPVQESGAPPSPGRRRLVKGLAAAAPGIFTLYSGNARAMLSTYQCIVKDREAFDNKSHLVTRIADGYQRTTAEVIRVTPEDQSEVRELAVVPDSGGARHYFELDPIDRQFSATLLDYPMKEWTENSNNGKFVPPDSAYSDARGQWGALSEQPGNEEVSLFCVDDDGNFVSVYPGDCGADKPVTGSCWTSFA